MFGMPARWSRRSNHQSPGRRPGLRCRPSLDGLENRTLLASSSLAYQGDSGYLVSKPDGEGDRIPDFSNVGYMGGTVPIPVVPVRATVSPGEGDDGDRIQDAINSVSVLPLDANGFRGAVLLRAGTYEIGGSLQISASGVVLRGEGDGQGGTVLCATGTSKRDLIIVSNESTRTFDTLAINIVDDYVPVGARSFRVGSTTGLAVGDTVIVRRPSPAEWIEAIHMDGEFMGSEAWEAGSMDLRFDRVITRIEGNRITLDAPLTNSLDRQFGVSTIQPYDWSDRLQNVGIENILAISDYANDGDEGYQSSVDDDEKHAESFIVLNTLQNAWVRNITAQHFSYSAVHILDDGKWITVENAQCLDPVSKIDGGRRYSFKVDGALNLVRDCYTRYGRHDYVQDSRTTGPNVFVDSRADHALSDSGPHERWSTGTLFDNIEVLGHELNVQNRLRSGSGHGWTGANMVIWNSFAEDGFHVQNPPTAQNWLIGSRGGIRTDSDYNPKPKPEPGIVDSHGIPVQPRSLYYTQLQDRLRNPFAVDLEYMLGDIDGLTDEGSADDVPVDPVWRSQLQSQTSLPLDGFDSDLENRWVPFTFEFDLAGGGVVFASLSLGLRRVGASSLSDNDRLYIDGLDRSFSLGELGWLPLPEQSTGGRVLNLSDPSLLALLQDGRLNLAITDDTAVDWAVLNIRVTPILVGEQATLNPTQDAHVRDGKYALEHYGNLPSLVVMKGEDGSGLNREAFLRFNLETVTAPVLWAAVELTPINVNDPVENAIAFVTDDTWTQTSITWNDRPEAGSAFASWIPRAGATSQVIVTPLVQEALAGDGRLSLKVFSTTQATNGLVTYGSRENSDIAMRPRLVIITGVPIVSSSLYGQGSGGASGEVFAAGTLGAGGSRAPVLEAGDVYLEDRLPAAGGEPVSGRVANEQENPGSPEESASKPKHLSFALPSSSRPVVVALWPPVAEARTDADGLVRDARFTGGPGGFLVERLRGSRHSRRK